MLAPLDDRLLTLREVSAAVTLSRSEIYRRIAADDFPRPLRIGRRRVAWRWRDVQQWMSDLGQLSECASPPVRPRDSHRQPAPQPHCDEGAGL